MRGKSFLITLLKFFRYIAFIKQFLLKNQQTQKTYVHVRATEERNVNAGPEDNVEEKGGKRGGPKKLFKWNEEIRSDIIKISRLNISNKQDRIWK